MSQLRFISGSWAKMFRSAPRQMFSSCLYAATLSEVFLKAIIFLRYNGDRCNE
jgi:hypothetical protein